MTAKNDYQDGEKMYFHVVFEKRMGFSALQRMQVL